jgi:hypothetical protein
MVTELEILEAVAAGGYVIGKGQTADFDTKWTVIDRLNKQGCFTPTVKPHVTSTGSEEVDHVIVKRLSTIGEKKLKQLRGSHA